MPIFGSPTDKTGGTGRRTVPVPIRVGSSIRITGAYQFGEGGGSTYTHGIWVSPPLNLATAPHSSFTTIGTRGYHSEFGLVENAAGVFNVPGFGSFFDLQAPAFPGSDVFADVGGTMVLHLTPEDNGTVALFPTVEDYYMLGVVLNTTGPTSGTFTPGNLVDLMVIKLLDHDQEVNQSITVGINTTLLATALGLAGHNLKLRDPVFINGLISDYELALFDRTVDIGLDPDDLADDTNLDGTHGATFTPDSQKNIQQDLTKPD